MKSFCLRDSIATACGGLLHEVLMKSARLRAQRCVSHLTRILTALASRENRVRPEHPPARVALFRAALPLWSATRPPRKGMARRLRTRSIARSLARTIVTCSKSAPPSNLAPRRRRPKTRRRFSADYVFGAARPKCRQPRLRKTTRAVLRPTMFSAAERRQPRPIYRRAYVGMRGGGTWVGLQSRAEGVPTAGGRVCCISRIFVGRSRPHAPTIRSRKTLQSERRGDCRVWCLANRRAISDMFRYRARSACRTGSKIAGLGSQSPARILASAWNRDGSVEPFPAKGGGWLTRPRC